MAFFDGVTSNRRCRVVFDRTHRRVMLSKAVDGSVFAKLAEARVDPETGKAVTVFLAVDESPVVQVVEPTVRARKVTSPR